MSSTRGADFTKVLTWIGPCDPGPQAVIHGWFVHGIHTRGGRDPAQVLGRMEAWGGSGID